MSEYQYYEFIAVDAPLTPQQIEKVRRVSSRADISATRFVNEYNFGDFKGDVDAFLADYFDLHVYVANWGTNRFAIAFPEEAVDRLAWRAYENEIGFEIRRKSGRAILEFWSELEEPEDYPEGDGWMASLAPVRNELLYGDTRALCLGKLAGLSIDMDMNEVDEEESVTIPAGLNALTAAQKALADFLRIDEDVLAAAAKRSAPAQTTSDTSDLAEWISSLPIDEKNRLLHDVASGAGAQVAATLRQRHGAFKAKTKPIDSNGVSVSDLILEAASTRDERLTAKREAARVARERRIAEAEASYARSIRELAAREPAAWIEVEQLIATRQSKTYEQAVQTLRDLREVAVDRGALDTFRSRVSALRESHRAKSSFIQRLDKAKLID